jgi:hypothetical protein
MQALEAPAQTQRVVFLSAVGDFLPPAQDVKKDLCVIAVHVSSPLSVEILLSHDKALSYETRSTILP